MFHEEKEEGRTDVSLHTASGENLIHRGNTGGVHIYVLPVQNNIYMTICLPDGHVQQQELTGAGKKRKLIKA